MMDPRIIQDRAYWNTQNANYAAKQPASLVNSQVSPPKKWSLGLLVLAFLTLLISNVWAGGVEEGEFANVPLCSTPAQVQAFLAVLGVQSDGDETIPDIPGCQYATKPFHPIWGWDRHAMFDNGFISAMIIEIKVPFEEVRIYTYLDSKLQSF